MSGIIHKLERSILGGAVIIGFFSFVSRILGLYRERLLAGTLSATNLSDAYFAAFRLPDFLFNIFVLGALSSAFIPVFCSLRKKDVSENIQNDVDKAESWRVTNSVMNILLLVVMVIGALFFVFTGPIVAVISPGYSPAKQLVIQDFARVMMIGVVFFTASNILAGILNSMRRYLAYSIAPIMYNIGIIVGLVWLYPKVGNIGLAWGVVLGAFLHLVVQIPDVVRTGYRYRLRIDWSNGVRRIAHMMGPRTLGLAVAQVNLIVITAIASWLDEGDLSVFNYANNLQHFPISVFGISLAVSAFPVFSQAVLEKDHSTFIYHFSKTFRSILFFLIPVSVIILLLRAQIVRIILGTGEFDWAATELTAQVLGIFAISLFAQALTPLLARSFYAHEDTKTPVVISVVTVIINVLLAIFLSKWYGVDGLAWAFTISSLLNMFLLLIVLRNRIGSLDDSVIVSSVFRVVIASMALGVAVQSMKYIIAPHVDMHTGVGVLLQASGSAAVGILFYVAFALVFKFGEVELLREWLRKLWRLLQNGNGQSAHS
ncbi:MAG: murein biosynthesis integral membrane protein MurJ [Candidatus Kerfeldbacteria bacterium]|nr:murein biosynthesis integral membrane protein MurJ [Candidatus Kerfeldbacteria bacterium]